MTLTKEERAERLDAAHELLTNAVAELVTGDDWARMLETASRFHKYSAGNVFLIMLQRPDATRVAGYKTWQSMGRRVLKGERGIQILAPCKYTRRDVDPVTGEEVTYSGVRGFTIVRVFDVSQTEGEELADVRPELLTGDAPARLWEQLADQVRAHGYEVAVTWSPQASAELLGSANGSTNPRDHVVTIRGELEPAQSCKTLAHELAHIVAGHADADRVADYLVCRGRCEVEAESAAYLVCSAVGLDTAAYTFPYVARWADGQTETVTKTADAAIKTARAIVEELGEELADAA